MKKLTVRHHGMEATFSIPFFSRFEEPLQAYGEERTLSLINWAIREKARKAAIDKLKKGMKGKETAERMKKWEPVPDRNKNKLRKLQSMLDALPEELKKEVKL